LDKNELLKQLQSTNTIEEEFVSIMSYFFQNVVDNLSLDPASLRKIDASLKVLEQDSLKHKAMIQELIEQVKQGQKNDY
jgi:DNA repair ATPase RecN